MNFTVLLYMGF